ncbi:MAG: M67 family metallopeptidase [Planctomycetota bacterium]|nr:M67 family metallopeptidase [Planctomycetota bacterium]
MLVLPADCRGEIEAFVCKGYPYETCGVMLGCSEGTKNIVSSVRQLNNTNTERANDRFEMDSDEMFAVQEEARSLGEEVVGIWHSHPDHPAAPSQTDLDKAWPMWSYIIASVTKDGVAAMTSWRLADDEDKRFEEERVNDE